MNSIRMAILASASLVASVGVTAQTIEDNTALTATISALDTRVFDAYNRCDLAAFGSYYSPTVEFYHDIGGATFDRKTVIANTKKYICNKVRRDLIASSLRVYPIKDFGAIEEGEHRFCQTSSGACEGVAKFVIIWKQTGPKWQITRVMSYGHRALVAEK
jgi:3D (Asp-Asp-Asp) domain-containing protein